MLERVVHARRDVACDVPRGSLCPARAAANVAPRCRAGLGSKKERCRRTNGDPEQKRSDSAGMTLDDDCGLVVVVHPAHMLSLISSRRSRGPLVVEQS
jgi:hypothetical protein